ncbi:MAG TPA: pyridoxal-phosphate dependent enzyme, partial [Geminicoccaceae bacterium]|nr:pyridoxal-phosphate dependent enzyme [Geminicoccaceae bacterium]
MSVTLADVEAAAERLRGQIVDTPCLLSRTISEITGAEVWLKFENHQYTASFKERGAYNRLARLSPAERKRGVIAMSAGNHAQGVAYHGRRLGVPATIVMPTFTPFSKVESTERLGARVLLRGDSVDDAGRFARELEEQERLTFIHPYDDPAIVAGQGTVALEMLRMQPDLDCLLVPIGGGGLIGGIATAAKALRPAIEIVGVEAALYPSVYNLLRGIGETKGGPTIADGIAVKQPGRLTLPIIERLVDAVLLVEEAKIEAAVLTFLEIEKT